METEVAEVAEVVVEAEGTETPTQVEEVAEVAPEPDKPSERELELSEKFNQVTERERVLRESEESNKSTADELREAREILAKFKDNPLEGLRAIDIDFKDVANLVINDEKPTAEMQVKQLREEIEDRRNKEETDSKLAEETKTIHEQKIQAQEQEAAVETARGEINTLIADNPEKYEMINTQNATDIVWDVAAGIYNKTKVLPKWEDVCDKVEDQLTKEVEKYYATDKFKSMYQKIPEKVSFDDERDLDVNYYGKQLIEEKYGRSLTNHMEATGAKAPERKDYRTDEESKSYLADKLKKMLEA
jgi:hypothetical protein